MLIKSTILLRTYQILLSNQNALLENFAHNWALKMTSKHLKLEKTLSNCDKYMKTVPFFFACFGFISPKFAQSCNCMITAYRNSGNAHSYIPSLCTHTPFAPKLNRPPP